MAGRARQLPLTGVLAVVGAGLLLAGLGAWRTGTATMGVGILLGAALRLALPVRQAGLLVVRSRRVDVVVLVALGAGLVVLASSVPTGA